MKINYLWQQLLSHLSVIIIAFLVISLLFSQFIENYIYTTKTDELTTYGTSILHDINNGQSNTRTTLQYYGQMLDARDVQYSLFDSKSSIIYSTGLNTPLIELSEAEWQRLKDGNKIVVKQEVKRFEEDVTFVLLPYFHQRVFVGGILLTSPVTGSREAIAEVNNYLLYATAIALIVALIVSLLLSTLHGRRIKRLREATSAVANGNYSIHLPTTSFDEIGELASDFNRMVERLDSSMDEITSLENRRRQFMADVSHELRTPLTTIRGIIEGLRNDMISEEEKEKGLTLASNETMRLIRLVNENLDYEKIRSNQITLVKQPIQVLELFEIIKEQLQIAAEERGNTIVLEVDEHAEVFADYDRLLQIILNITKNSIQFTENGSITLTGRQETTSTVLEIVDTGMGMDAKEIEQIWNRFYKAIVSRTTNPYGEFGLGLSIVKQLVTLHGGTISVTSEKGVGTTFTIILPAQ